jgi:hypothetical protein
MASIAVFQQLFNEKKDIFDIVAEFIKQEVFSRGLQTFSLQEMHSYLMEVNGFDVPQAVISTSVKRISYFEKNKDIVTVTKDISIDELKDFQSQVEQAQINRDQLSARLVKYASEQLGCVLTDDDKNELCKTFYAYVIDEDTLGRFSEIAGSFILANQNDADFQQNLNNLREGIITFVGLTYYNNNAGEIDSFDKELYIYLETEILFHMAGYNGQLYKNLFDEFYAQICEINKRYQIRHQKKVIYLRYFPETLKEIDEYFEQAESVVRREKTLDPSKAAMKSLTQGAKAPCDIANKRDEFQQILSAHSISLEQFSVDLTQRQNVYIDFNIADRADDLGGKMYEDSKLLNYIALKRGGRKVYSLSNTKAILLTGNYHVIQRALSLHGKEKPEILLATTLDFLTERFWFSLNRGLANGCDLISAKVLTRARLALAALNKDSICKAYHTLNEEARQNESTTEQLQRKIIYLYRRARLPEDVDDLTNKGCLAFFDNHSIESLMAEQAAIEEANNAERKRIVEDLQSETKAKSQAESSLNSALVALLAERNKTERESHKSLLNQHYANLRNAVKCGIKRPLTKHVIVLIVYAVVAIGSVVLGIISQFNSNSNSNKTSDIIISAAIGILAIALPFAINAVRRAVVFLFCRRLQRDYCRNLCREYFRTHERPKLQLTTMDELMNEHNAPSAVKQQ